MRAIVIGELLANTFNRANINGNELKQRKDHGLDMMMMMILAMINLLTDCLMSMRCDADRLMTGRECSSIV